MNYYALFYDVVDDYVARRAQFREEHMKLALAAHRRGELILGGALGDPVEQALIIFRSSTPEAAENFARNDPYVMNGLVSRWQVRPWTVVIGNE
jgi:uncharacterized protein YciI